MRWRGRASAEEWAPRKMKGSPTGICLAPRPRGGPAMKGKLVLGTFLIVVGFILAVVAAAGLREPGNVRTAPGVIVGDQNQRGRDEAASIMLPVLAGLSIAAGAALVGIGMGFRRPLVVSPHSPKADEAATTRPLNDESAMRRRNAGG